ncbi:Crp/Fnr family transcriptional regulator [bacterium]|nr:Crp/Fnr family transcriptional regulator [bacterium]
MDKIKLLKKVGLFFRLSSKNLNKIAKISYIQNYKKEEDIFSEGDEGDKLYIVISGLIKIFKISSGERIKTLALLKKGDFFGEMAILDKELRSATAQAMEDTEMMVIDNKSFRLLLKDNSGMLFNMIETLCFRLREANKQIQIMTFQNIMGRTAAALLNLAARSGEKTQKGIKINMEITHQELANLVGTAREIITKVLSSFKRNGYLIIDDHYITIIDKEKLKEVIC